MFMKKNTILFSVILLIALQFTACSDSSEDGGGSEVNSSEYLWYFSGKIDGVPFVYGQREDLTGDNYFLSNSNTLPSTCAYSSDNGFTYNTGIYPSFDESLPTMDLEFVRMHICSSGSSQSEVFNDLFPVKEYTLAESDEDIDENAGKVGAYYSPSASGVDYYNTYGGSQAGSYFEITSSVPYNETFAGYTFVSQEIEGNFSLTLYNQNDPSDTVEITEGKFKITLEP